MVNDTWKWSIGRITLKMKYSVNEFFGLLFLDQGGILVKKSIEYSCIILSGIQWIDVEHNHNHIEDELLGE
jgi:hypothetical protein